MMYIEQLSVNFQKQPLGDCSGKKVFLKSRENSGRTPERTVPKSHSLAPNNIWGSRNEDSHKNIKDT